MSGMNGAGSGLPGQIIAPAPPSEPPKAKNPTTLDVRTVKDKGPADKPPAPQRPKGPVPATGWAGFRYQQNVRKGRPDQVPNLSPSEKLAYEMWYLISKINYMSDYIQPTVAFVNIKGGASKTTTALYVGNIFTSITRRVAFALPATSATQTSTTAFNAGIKPGKTRTVSEFARELPYITDYRLVSRKAPRTDHGLCIVSEDHGRKIDKKDKFSLEMFEGVVSRLRECTDFIALDTGNDDIDEDSLVLSAIRNSDVVVFTATADNATSLEKLRETIVTYSTDMGGARGGARTPGTARENVFIPTREKVANSLAVISGAEPGEKPDDFYRYVTHVDDDGRYVSTAGFEGSIALIPHDPYIGDKKRGIVSNPDRINLETYMAYLRLLEQIFVKAAHNQGVPINFEPDVDKWLREAREVKRSMKRRK